MQLWRWFRNVFVSGSGVQCSGVERLLERGFGGVKPAACYAHHHVLGPVCVARKWRSKDPMRGVLDLSDRRNELRVPSVWRKYGVRGAADLDQGRRLSLLRDRPHHPGMQCERMLAWSDPPKDQPVVDLGDLTNPW